ncbi:MAG: alpha/beta hydrolase [Paludibacteraceae bacterium]|nr:alpha/beta hydrolase [Paludibacteraceae bacterium]
MKMSKCKNLFIFLLAALCFSACTNTNDKMSKCVNDTWDKVFPLSEKVNHQKVSFQTQYGFTLVGDLYTPKSVSPQDGLSAERSVSETVCQQSGLPALAVSGPFGATKEQSSGLYAMKMAERGFITLAFDPSFTGESSGEPRRTASPDINTEDFMAAVDFLSKLPEVDANRIGIIGICGWGGIALNAAAADTRIKATVASTMYDMTRVAGNDYNDAFDDEQWRHRNRENLSQQRLADPQAMAGGVLDTVPPQAPRFVHDYYDYYKTPRGYHARSGNSNDGWRVIGTQAYANSRFLYYINEIRSAVLIMHGADAHSRYFGEAAYHYMVDGKADGYKTVVAPNPCPENKELLIIPDASHCDLYDGGFTEPAGQGEPKNLIPWDKLAAFFEKNL